MPVTRADLEQNRARKALARSPLAPELLSDEALEASLQETLWRHTPGADLWLFGYGSLVWNPSVRYLERWPAKLHGYHRCFCLWSRINRGTPERPGLALGLDAGGCCRGVVFRIPGAEVRTELRVLWRREMLMGSYQPRWVTVRRGDDRLTALTFVINRAASGYTGHLSENEVAATLAGAEGLYGTGADYLLRTVEGLSHCGIPDHRLERLRDLVLERMSSR
jgi:cation transport protein ChaC